MDSSEQDAPSPSLTRLAKSIVDFTSQVIEKRDEILNPATDRVMDRFGWVISTIGDPDDTFRIVVHKGMIAGFFLRDDELKEHGLLEMQSRKTDAILEEIMQAAGRPISDTAASIFRMLGEAGVTQGYALNSSLRVTHPIPDLDG